MQTGLIHAHSLLRYFVLILLILVVVKSLLGWISQKPFTKTDNQLSLWLLIFTHTQFLIGLALYLMSDVVKFGAETMSNSQYRYWTVEHSVMMILAIVLITVARITHKKLPADPAKHKRLFILNTIALIIIVVAILASGRGLLIPVRYQ